MFTTTILSILAWMSISQSVSQRLKSSYAVGTMFAACGIILILFAGMLIGILSYTYYLILIGALIHAVLRGWTTDTVGSKLRWNKATYQSFKASYSPLYLVAILTVVFFLRKVFPDFMFFGWDEFSHWARYTKILVNTSLAPVENPSVLFPAYPPGINLWHYFICGPGGYAEWKVVFAQMLLIVSIISFISTGFDRVKGLGAVVLFLFGLMMYYAFETNLYEIYTDCILGLLFGAALITARQFALEGSTRSETIAFACLLATISLIKPIAILFGITSAGLFFGLRIVLQILQKFSKQQSSQTKETTSRIDNIKVSTTFVQTAQILLSSLTTVIVWKLYTSSKSIPDPFVGIDRVNFSSIIEFLFTRDTKETQIAWKELGDRVGFDRVSYFGSKQFRLDLGYFDSTMPIYLGAMALIIGAIGLILLRAIINHKKAIQTTAEAVYLTATFFIYLVLIVFIIRHYFQIWDIERLASLERYLSSFLLGLFLFAVATLFAEISNLKWPKYEKTRRVALPLLWTGLGAFVVTIAPVSLDNTFAKPLDERPVPGVHPWADDYHELEELRKQVANLSYIVKSNAKLDDRIFVIAQNETGYTFYMAGHELSPLSTNSTCFSVGEKYYDGDKWTCDYLDLSVALADYDYVVIRRADEAFWDRFGNLFESTAIGSKSGVYKVEKDIDNVISLKTIYQSDEARGVDSPS